MTSRVVTTRRRDGTVDAAVTTDVLVGQFAADFLVRQAAAAFMTTVRSTGLSDEEVVDLVRRALPAW